MCLEDLINYFSQPEDDMGNNIIYVSLSQTLLI